MIRLFTAIIFLYVFSLELISQTEKTYQLEDLIITANRTPTLVFETARNITVIDSNTVSKLPVNNVSDALNYFGGIDIIERGPNGIQGDLTIRGGTFEQALVLVDGIRFNDPQTGHHNLNLPLNFENIDRIEILKGHGSRIYGPNAFSGVINIITKKTGNPFFRIGVGSGSFNSFNYSAEAVYPLSILMNRISFQKNKSDGYRHNTNSDINNCNFSSALNLQSLSMDFSIGYQDKEFGASNFYSDKYPNQWEHTKTTSTNLKSEYQMDSVIFSSTLAWRRNKDDYMLDFARPSWYRNLHITNSYSGGLQIFIPLSLGKISIGTELNKDEIESTNLGNHNRTNYGLFVEDNFSVYDFDVAFGGYAYNYSGFGWKIWPGLDIGYNFNKNVKLFFSAGKSFRIPSFTDLYYTSPAQKGNTDLRPEEAGSFEIGFKYKNPLLSFDINAFTRYGKNIIDWSRKNSDEIWIAGNVNEITTRGFESTFNISLEEIGKNFPFIFFNIDYSYLSSDLKPKYQSRYALDNLKHKLVLSIGNDLFFNITQSWFFRFEERINMKSFFITDTKIKLQDNPFNFFFSVNNLFNISYMDLSGIPMPGRWFKGGIDFKLSE